jgi:hypothetical protein
MTIEISDITYSFTLEPELNMINGYGEIKIFLDDDSEQEETIGSISFNFYNGYEFDSNQELLISSDSVSGDEVYMIHTFLESDFDRGKIVTLDRINVLEAYNSVEIELQILKEFVEFCIYMDFDYIVVIAANPLNHDQKGIIEFSQLKPYRELNFTKLGGTDNRLPVMIKVLDEI